jgi:hypothetical protein
MRTVSDAISPPSDAKAPTTQTYLKWGCLAVVGLGICVCLFVFLGGAGLIAKFGGEPEGLSAEYTMPGLVQKGENFELVINLTNMSDAELFVTDIDLDEAFDSSILDGAVVLSTDPPMQKDYSLSGIKTFYYNRALGPGETHTVRFTLQAVNPGEFGGSIGIYVGDKAKRFDYVGIVISE